MTLVEEEYFFYHMSVIEELLFFHQIDPKVYLTILKEEHGAIEVASYPGRYFVDQLPFYAPKLTDEYVYVLGFNYLPLSRVLIDALASHPELVPDDVLILWLIEQDPLLETTMGKFRKASEHGA